MIRYAQNPAVSGPAAKLENQWPLEAAALVQTFAGILLR
jgi:hypothetical protein